MTVITEDRMLLSGNEAIALALYHGGVAFGAGYPGTPSTEILENFAKHGGKAEWAPNEKVAFEVALGASFGGARAVVTMKHVGLNVAADPLFTAAYTGTPGALVVAVADDPGMASSQNEQDSRRYAVAAGLPMLEPSDSQEAYAMTLRAIELSETHGIPVLLRLTTRVCHAKTIIEPCLVNPLAQPKPAGYKRDVPSRVMIPAYARPAHRRLRAKLFEIGEWSETCDLNFRVEGGSGNLGIISSGIAAMHAHEAAPGAEMLKLGVTHPLPLRMIQEFASSVDRCVVIEEGDPFLADSIRAAGIDVESKPEIFRFNELNVARVRKIIDLDTTPEPMPPKGRPPQLCMGCPHRAIFEVLRDLGCIVSGDIGCYTLGVLPPFEALDTCVCMGASIGVGLGLRHVLPEAQARKVVSVIGDSTFVHSGLTGIAEMVYNRPATGHVVLILDNGTTAMTGLQEHPGTGRTLAGEPSVQMVYEDVVRAMGVQEVDVIDPVREHETFANLVKERLAGGKLCVIIARRPCILNAVKKA